MTSDTGKRPKEDASLAHLLLERAESSASTVGFTYLSDGERTARPLTYGELLAIAAQVARRLRAERGHGQNAIVLGLSGLEYIVALFACFLSGTIAVPLAPLRPNRNSQAPLSIIDDCAAKFVLGNTGQLDSFRQSTAHLPSARALVYIDVEIPGAIPRLDGDFPISPHSVAYLQYTSGSTAAPRGVVLTHQAVLANACMITEAFEHPRGRAVVSWLPLYHDMGLIANVIEPLYVGAPSIFMSPFAFLQRPLRWLEAIHRYDGASSGAPNFAYELCAKRAPRPGDIDLDLSRWSLAYCGSEPIRAESLATFAERYAPFGFKKEAFYPCYGLAEATLFVCGGGAGRGAAIQRFDTRGLSEGSAKNPASDCESTPLVGCGWPRGNLEVLIVDPSTHRQCAPGQIGEIWLRGSNLATGYWNDIRKTRETFGARLVDGRGPYLRTGDLGFQWKGEFYISGRRKDLIIIDGCNHYPPDIEKAAERSDSAIRPCGAAAFAVDRAGREQAVVVVEIDPAAARKLALGPALSDCRDPMPESIRRIAAAVRRSVQEDCDLSLGAVVIVLSGRIPRTTSGKIQRSLCRERYLEGSWSWIDEPRVHRLREPQVASSEFGPSLQANG